MLQLRQLVLQLMLEQMLLLGQRQEHILQKKIK